MHATHTSRIRRRSGGLLLAMLMPVFVAWRTNRAPGIESNNQPPASAPIRVVDPAWLSSHLNDPDLVVLQIEMDAAPSARIPGARVVPYRALIVNRDGLSTELPSPDSLAALIGRLGIGPNTLVVATTTHEPPMAARALMTLDVLGHPRLAFLSGGVSRWKREGHALATSAPQVTPVTYPARTAHPVVVTAEWIRARQAGRGLALIDTRTDGEFDGTGNRSGMPSDGHPVGARQLEWQQLFSDSEFTVLHDSTILRKLYSERMSPGDTAVTYCWIGYRASMTYVAARTLGLPVRFYDGSYQDWQIRKLPVQKGR
ncbi:MAG: sulfurtransferase [Gemmatimonadaceae bacterium]|nr:sulfurtransferase [Gemmatimonadaceae bacterium]